MSWWKSGKPRRAGAVEDGWRTYQPRTPAAVTGTVNMTLVRLLILESELAQRTSVDALAAFCQEVTLCAQRAFAHCDDDGELLIRMRCSATGHGVEMAGRGELAQSAVQALYDSVGQLAALPVRQGEVAFEIELAVAPSGTGVDGQVDIGGASS